MVKAFILLFFVLTLPVSAKNSQKGRWLTTSFIQAYLPANWSCKVKAKQWECKQTQSVKSREATILLSAKVSGPEDNLSNYKNYLSHPIIRPNSNRSRSKVLGIRQVNIHGQKWIDGYHKGSELKTWNSRYLATTKSGLAILISLSNHSAKEKEYKAIFSKIVSSFRVNIKKQISNRLTKIAPKRTARKPIVPLPLVRKIPSNDNPLTLRKKYLFGFLIIIFSGLVIFIIKRKK